MRLPSLQEHAFCGHHRGDPSQMATERFIDVTPERLHITDSSGASVV